jgi:branched-subunit amino acid aminotransferase/4-amino-4-deoxychorismate lyase
MSDLLNSDHWVNGGNCESAHPVELPPTEQALVEELARVTEERDTLTTRMEERVEDLETLRDDLLRIIRHMRRIALPYPQWEQWWAQLGGEVVAVERKLAYEADATD